MNILLYILCLAIHKRDFSFNLFKTSFQTFYWNYYIKTDQVPKGEYSEAAKYADKIMPLFYV